MQMSFIDTDVPSDKSGLTNYPPIDVYLASGILQHVQPTIFIHIMHFMRAVCLSLKLISLTIGRWLKAQIVKPVVSNLC